MKERAKIQGLVGLLLVAGAVYWYEQSSSPAMPTVLSANTRFVPLSVQEPALQMDRLKELQKDEYAGAHRNIFVAGPSPPPPGAAHFAEAPRPFVGPQLPPPPPPLQVPVEFYGVESSNGMKVALFKNGDDPLIVAEGATFMNRFRLVKIANTSADVEEISSGRHASVPLVQPDQGSGTGQNAGGNPPPNPGSSQD